MDVEIGINHPSGVVVAMDSPCITDQKTIVQGCFLRAGAYCEGFCGRSLSLENRLSSELGWKIACICKMWYTVSEGASYAGVGYCGTSWNNFGGQLRR